jgi:hypothetical protein
VGEDTTRKVDVRIIAATNRAGTQSRCSAFPPGPLLPAQRLSNRDSAASPTQRRYSSSGRPFRVALS